MAGLRAISALPGIPPAPQNLRIDTVSRKYHFSIQILLNNDHLGAWLASGPYLPSPAFPPAPQNLGIDTLSRKYHFSIQTLLNIDHLGAWLASGPYLPSPAFPRAPQNLGIDTLSRKYYFSIQTLLNNDHLGACGWPPGHICPPRHPPWLYRICCACFVCSACRG